MKKRIDDLLSSNNYDLRVSNNGRWMDQKCTPDVVSFIADCICNYTEEFGREEFYSVDIWTYDYSSNLVQDIFRKPKTNSLLSVNEYDKFFSQPLKMLAYAGILSEEKRGTTNYYSINEIEILQFISYKERNALMFIDSYLKKVLMDSEIWDSFDKFFNEQDKVAFTVMKETFETFTIANTSITKLLEPRRIFTKILNPLAFVRKSKGTVQGRMSRLPISYDQLMYNRANFRDIWSGKPSDITRKQWEDQFARESNPNYFKYQSNKAKRLLRQYNEKYNDGNSEYLDSYSAGKGTHMHHIFPESDFPSISGYVENLIALTPTQHLNIAHPDNHTTRIDIAYQEQLLKQKALIIEECSEKGDDFYSFDSFNTVLNTGFNYEEFVEANDYNSCMLLINNYFK